MKKTLLFLAVILFTTTSYSQNELEKAAEKSKTETPETNTKQPETDEPEWVGQAIYLNDGKITELESQKAYSKVNASASVFIIGV